MTANASSSSVTAAPEDADEPQQRAPVQLPPLPQAFVEGKDLELLQPLHFLAPGQHPADLPATNESEIPETTEDPRAPLALALGAANQAYGHPRAEELAARLAQRETRVVVTGQQPGLWGGPLMALVKMAAAARWAEALEQAGQPAVAVFWMATEDHDWAEVARADLQAGDETRRFELGPDPAPLLPVGMRGLGSGLLAGEELLVELYGDRGREAAQILGRWYRPDARFGEAFARLSAYMLGDRCPLLLDAQLPAVKRAQKPWLRRLVEERQEVDQALAQAHRQIEERGYPLQVRPQPGLSPLFLLHGQERRRIVWMNEDRFGLRGLEGFSAPVEQLLETIDENPGAVSPGVLARPAIQDAILRTHLQLMGPAEMSYLPQAAGTYRTLGLQGPWTSLRPRAAIIDHRQARHLDQGQARLAELLSGEDLEQVLGRTLGEDPVLPVREAMARQLEALREPVLGLDPNLEKPWSKTRDRVLSSLDQLSGKATAAMARQHSVALQRMGKLRAQLSPGGVGQERVLSWAHFLARHGRECADELYQQMELDPTQLRVVRLAPPGGAR